MFSPSIILDPIVGGLSQNRASIWARANAPSILHVWLAARTDLKDAKLVGKVELLARDGCAGIQRIDRLKPETKYHYAVSLRRIRPGRDEFHTFTTFPEPHVLRSFSFTFGSCYLPPDEHGGQTMDELQRHIESDNLRFGLFLGDQIYADAADWNGINRIAVTLEEYRAVYEYTWSRPAMRGLLPSLPLFMTLDDHEVDDDWYWRDPEHCRADIPAHSKIIRWLKRLPPQQRQLSAERARAALKAYYEHQSLHAPEMLPPFGANVLSDTGPFAYTFYFGGTAFFVLDTRTMRVKGSRKSLLGEVQWAALQEWFREVKDQYPVKFLVSSGTMLYPFWLDFARDRWDAFPAERERLLKILAINEIEGLYILTGDMHSAHAVSAELKCPNGHRIPIWEFCSSPFEQGEEPATITYHPLFSKWVGSQKRLFRQTGQNFGVVHVDFDSSPPYVSFNLHYYKNGWKTRPPVVTPLNV